MKSIPEASLSCTDKTIPLVGFGTAVVLLFVFWQQKKLREFCERNGNHVIAYSPLDAKGTIWGSRQVMECDVFNDIAKAREKTIGKVGPINQI
ncbi:hypothetical protein Acr_29g0005240 [Actinidia rufa]|uniref:Uncharacterized protein n=1 Tax=Actinidia rufa TaxID=165716 RepID=A0A7J0HEA7_9ERIC|nr:hypothetical protein Acr_29g0005240 [Actinidia rufa]